MTGGRERGRERGRGGGKEEDGEEGEKGEGRGGRDGMREGKGQGDKHIIIPYNENKNTNHIWVFSTAYNHKCNPLCRAAPSTQ